MTSEASGNSGHSRQNARVADVGRFDSYTPMGYIVVSMRRYSAFLVVTLLLLVAAACGGSKGGSTSGEASGGPADRTVEVDMRDIAFSPSTLDVRQGETVRFVFTNTGQIVHDAFIGTEAAQAEHETEMRQRGHGGHSGGQSGVSVKPGKKAELTHTFAQPGQVLIGCHQPGHYTGGMRITVNVA